MLKGVAKLALPTIKQDKHEPITIQMISLIKDKLDHTNPFNIAFLTCLIMIFYTATQVGEFTTRKLDAFDPTEHISHREVHDNTDCNGLHTKVFTIPWTKSSSTSKEVHWAKQDGPTDPLEAFNRHIKINDPSASGPLFTYKGPKGHQSMTHQSFVICLNKATQAAGLNCIHGHGIHIGATLEYLLHGIPFDMMKVKGRWASNTFQLYLKKHNQILAPYMQSMPPETATKLIRLAMPLVW